MLKVAPGHPPGFTIVELMVASSVLTIALLGVYSIFHQAQHVEGRSSVRWQQQAAAEAVAEHLAQTLERTVNLSSSMPTLNAGPDEDGTHYQLTCVVGSAPGLYATGYRPTIQWHRYRWPLERDEDGMSVSRQTTLWNGAVNVTAEQSGGALGDADPWAGTRSHVVASQVQGITLRFRRASDPEAQWRGRWSGPVGDVVIRIQVRVGQARAQRTVVPVPSGMLLDEEN